MQDCGEIRPARHAAARLAVTDNSDDRTWVDIFQGRMVKDRDTSLRAVNGPKNRAPSSQQHLDLPEIEPAFIL